MLKLLPTTLSMINLLGSPYKISSLALPADNQDELSQNQGEQNA